MNNGRIGRPRKQRRKPETTPVGLNTASRGNGAQKEIIVNVSNRETRIALLEDGHLMEYRVEREERVVGVDEGEQSATFRLVPAQRGDLEHGRQRGVVLTQKTVGRGGRVV